MPKNEEYRAWYMLNVYPKRKTNPQELPQELDIEIHNKNLIAIKIYYPKLRRQMYGVHGVILSERENTCMTCCLETKKMVLTVLLACSMETITLRHTDIPLRGVLNTLL